MLPRTHAAPKGLTPFCLIGYKQNLPFWALLLYGSPSKERRLRRCNAKPRAPRMCALPFPRIRLQEFECPICLLRHINQEAPVYFALPLRPSRTQAYGVIPTTSPPYAKAQIAVGQRCTARKVAEVREPPLRVRRFQATTFQAEWLWHTRAHARLPACARSPKTNSPAQSLVSNAAPTR